MFIRTRTSPSLPICYFCCICQVAHDPGPSRGPCGNWRAIWAPDSPWGPREGPLSIFPVYVRTMNAKKYDTGPLRGPHGHFRAVLSLIAHVGPRWGPWGNFYLGPSWGIWALPANSRQYWHGPHLGPVWAIWAVFTNFLICSRQFHHGPLLGPIRAIWA